MNILTQFEEISITGKGGDHYLNLDGQELKMTDAQWLEVLAASEDNEERLSAAIIDVIDSSEQSHNFYGLIFWSVISEMVMHQVGTLTGINQF